MYALVLYETLFSQGTEQHYVKWRIRVNVSSFSGAFSLRSCVGPFYVRSFAGASSVPPFELASCMRSFTGAFSAR